ncbi:hypothetical protein [Paludisphaera soli]|uniref:hypothetical protein n=1 Tax=Paludisphaera soli TaxID=2712865 RepID=UPI0013EBCDD2|nr:hypothetical protein [Paludisphaera soli]
MSGRLLSPARLQALGMVVIGVLAGYAVASAWNRLGSEPARPAPPPADARDAGPEATSRPGLAPSR